MASENPSSSSSSSSTWSNTSLSMTLLGGLLPTSLRACEQATVGRQGREWANFQHTSLTVGGGTLSDLAAGGVLGGINTEDALWVDGVVVRVG
jgi:hypothetical protein